MLTLSTVPLVIFQAVGFPHAGPCPGPTMDSLSRMSWGELECLYRAASPGPIPCGYLEGRAIYDDTRPLSGPRGRASQVLWKGKHITPGGMVNQWAGFRAVPARVSVGRSWLDGCPAIILDYRGTSPVVWRRVRDEIREVSPGLYLGVMFADTHGGPRQRAYFVLRLTPTGGGPIVRCDFPFETAARCISYK